MAVLDVMDGDPRGLEWALTVEVLERRLLFPVLLSEKRGRDGGEEDASRDVARGEEVEDVRNGE